MLIRVSSGSARDHRKERQRNDDAQWRTQRGIALAALQVKTTGKPMLDGHGNPLYYANGASNLGFKELENKLKCRPGTTVVVGDVKATGAKRTPWEWEKNAG